MPESNIYSVSEITRIIKLLIEDNLPTIWVEGEISNFKAHYSGHYYFTLKDVNAQLSAVMWKSRCISLSFQPEDGMLIQALGNIRLFEKSGRYQLDVIRMQPAGIGKLQMQFELLKQKLEAEGLFDLLHKKALPRFPLKIGIVTSPTGAAIQDILNIMGRRAPYLEIYLRPTKVQGTAAAQDIADAIADFNEYGQTDLIIITRGGGSLEDLWPFNEEIVARAIYGSKLPIISAVGHEIDYTIADFVADLRAPTPSAAAELAVPDGEELNSSILLFKKRLMNLILTKIDYRKERLNSIIRSYGFRRPSDLLKQYSQQLDILVNRMQQNFRNLIQLNEQYCRQLNLRLDNLNPKKVLRRGYSISYVGERLLKDIDEVALDMEMRTELFRGNIISLIKSVRGNQVDQETKNV